MKRSNIVAFVNTFVLVSAVLVTNGSAQAPTSAPILTPVPAATPATALPAQCDASTGKCVVEGGNFVLPLGQHAKEVVVEGGSAQVFGDVEKDVVVMGGKLVVQGNVGGDAVVMGGRLEVLGHVAGDVVTIGGAMHLGPAAAVAGDAVVIAGNMAVDDGASVAGDRVALFGSSSVVSGLKSLNGHFDFSPPWWLGSLLRAAAVICALFIGFLVAVVFQSRSRTALTTLATAPGRALAFGIVAAIATTILLIAFTITIIGIPVALIVAAVFLVAWTAGLAVAASSLGRALLRNRPGDHALLAASLGAALLVALALVPYVGSWVLWLAAITGLGALLARGAPGPAAA